ncbi:MAG: putative Peptidase signal peptide peptidase SppA [Nitrospirae bacterium]|jgi:protease-4|nr:putative Peptidase signal peptide peptidase SppA [Nitrospirota bacterium]MBS1192128.1 putative Peptidase signal peptide peptidase SppA [Nitrospirota bacterium]
MKNKPILMILVAAFGLGVIFFAVLYLATLVSGGRSSRPLAPLPGMDKVALVKIEGLLVNADHIVEEINDHADDSSIKAIIIRIDSPGGGVVVSQEIYNAVLNARNTGKKKVVMSLGSVAASGGYYIAAAGDRIVANPGTLTGSIGVKMEFANVEKLLEKIGVKGMVVKAGEYKDIGSPYREMSEPEKKLLQAVIDDVHSQFIEAVAKGRNLPEADVKAIADGRVFTGRQALQLKLVDQLGDLEDSILVAAEMAGIKGKPKIVKKEKKVPFLEYFKEEAASWFSEVVSRGLDHSRMSLQYRY